MPYGALDEIIVLDLSDRLAASFCAKTLGLYGCEVIKVEPLSGDPLRKWTNSNPGNQSGDSPLFLHLNAGKKSITINLVETKGQNILAALMKVCDVVIETHKPGHLDKIGLAYNQIKKSNASIIFTSITPYGQTGPYKNFHYDELALFAMTGAMYREGLPDREPLRYSGEIAQYFAGNAAAAATTAALFKRTLTGHGDWLDISIQECMAGHPHQIGRRAPFIYAGEPDPRSQPRTSASGAREPYAVGTFRCKDGYFSFLPLGPRMWPNIAKMINREDLMVDPKYNDTIKRSENREKLEAIFQAWVDDKTREEIFQAVQAAGVPGSPILRPEEVHKNEQFQERGFFQNVGHPNGQTLRMTGDPFRFSNAPTSSIKAAPKLSQNTNEVLRKLLELSDAQIEMLAMENII
ncbi:MAG TPA: CoA transferase [Dehalococcoidia bacterium]|nr:CoA transferase [Dehalococcoidia bacterium]